MLMVGIELRMFYGEYIMESSTDLMLALIGAIIGAQIAIDVKGDLFNKILAS